MLFLSQAAKDHFPRDSQAWYARVAVILLIAVTAASFHVCLDNGFVAWDDGVHLSEDAIQSTTVPTERLRWIFATAHGAGYDPLFRMANWLQLTLFGWDARPFHLVSVLLHGANVLLSFVVVRRLGFGQTTALVAALLFAVHPTRAEAVAWFSAQKHLECALFALLGLVVYSPILTGARARPRLLGTWLLFSVAGLFQSIAVAFPVLLVVLDLAYGRPLVRSVLEKAPFWLVSGLLAGAKLLAAAGYVEPVERSFAAHYATTVQLPFLYLSRAIWPLEYNARFFVTPQAGFFALTPALHLLLLVAVAFAFGLLVKRVSRRYALLLLGWPVACMLPVLNLVPVPTVTISDRFLYLALLGPFAVAAHLWTQKGRVLAPLTATILILLPLVLGGALLSHTHAKAFRSTTALWEASFAAQPQNPVTRYYLAAAML
ncbi:hypothetical protein ACFL59_16450, partial [Planctomycetota bacterium]